MFDIVVPMRDWFSGRMTAFQAVDKGSIPLSRTDAKRRIHLMYTSFFVSLINFP